MANLKSYSCPKCGSYLDVDRDQDMFECPFCGSVFDVADFHGKELLDQAAELMRRKEFKKAREKYEYLLSKKPNEFEFLYGYACSVGEVDTLDDFEFPKSMNGKLVSLFKNDPRFQVGSAAAYFAKLLEMFNTANEVLEKKILHKKLVTEAENGILEIKREQGVIGAGIGIYAAMHYFIGAVILISIGDKFDLGKAWGTLILLFYILFPIVLIIVNYSINIFKQGKKSEEYAARIAPYNDMKKRADTLSDEIDKLEKMYSHYYKELPGLKPKASGFLDPVPVNRDPKKSEVTADPKRAVICKKCGAELTNDKERKLYICSHCGVSYDYSTFIGDDITKANTHLKNREFAMADKWFSKCLENEPGSFDANRGRILCAGKWLGFLQVKLNDKLEQVDWDGVKETLGFALENSNDFNKSYFLELKGLLDNAKEYFDTCLQMEGDGDNAELPALIRKRDGLVEEYNRIYRDFIEKDKKHRIAISNDLAYAADKMLAYRLRIISGTSWESIEAADPDVVFAPGVKYSLMTLIDEAKDVSKDEYYDYFNLWGRFIDEFVSYSLFVMKHKQLKAKDEEFALKNHTDDLTVLKETISKYDGEAKGRKKRFDDIHNELVEMDKKLFFEKGDDFQEEPVNGEA